MNPEELLRLIDMLQSQKDVSKEAIFLALEDALAQGVRKRLGVGEELVVHIDRKSGEVTVEDEEGEYEIELGELGRIAAQAVKQGFVQRLREAERDVLYEEFENRVGTLVNGQVQRYEGQDLVVNMGRAEAYLSREDRVRGETSLLTSDILTDTLAINATWTGNNWVVEGVTTGGFDWTGLVTLVDTCGQTSTAEWHILEYPCTPGCTQSDACNYFGEAAIEDGSCVFPGDECKMKKARSTSGC